MGSNYQAAQALSPFLAADRCCPGLFPVRANPSLWSLVALCASVPPTSRTWRLERGFVEAVGDQCGSLDLVEASDFCECVVEGVCVRLSLGGGVSAGRVVG